MASKRVLIVDDEENIGRSLRMILEREGYGVNVCKSVAEFGRHPDAQRADAYLFDMKLPEGMQGVVISRVEPMSPAFDAEVERGHVLLEINRHPVRSVEDYRRLTANAKAGDILALYIYKPESDSRALHTVKIE